MATTFQEIEIVNCVKVLNAGGTLLYPTDTIWGIGCDAMRSDSVSSIYRLKQREEGMNFIILLEDDARLEEYVETVPPTVRDLLSAMSNTPLTIIYPRGKNLAENVMGKDGSIAIRIVKSNFCKELLRQFKKPIVSTSANVSGQPSPSRFSDISKEILLGVDHVAIVKEELLKEVRPSRIIKLEENGMFKVIRD